MKTKLDFIIIGAQKAGTTSLFRYLNEHPNIYMPPGKENPFFSDNETFARGWAWYINEYYNEAPAERVWGKATPPYMTYPGVPGRIRRILPDVKLIALLRNPLERAYSHYRMCVLRNLETRSFEEAVSTLLEPETLEESRRNPSETNSYITSGEYGRILKTYYEQSVDCSQ